MVRPVYIACARSGSEDKASGLVSLFELIEKYEIVRVDLAKRDVPPIIIQPQPLRMVATWMMEPEKGERYGDTFEYEFRLVLPPKPTFHRIRGGTFQFAEPRPLHRFTIQIEAPLPFEGPGVMWVESAVRRVGEEAWTIQSYPIFLEEGPPPPAASSPPTP